MAAHFEVYCPTALSTHAEANSVQYAFFFFFFFLTRPKMTLCGWQDVKIQLHIILILIITVVVAVVVVVVGGGVAAAAAATVVVVCTSRSFLLATNIVVVVVVVASRRRRRSGCSSNSCCGSSSSSSSSLNCPSYLSVIHSNRSYTSDRRVSVSPSSLLTGIRTCVPGGGLGISHAGNFHGFEVASCVKESHWIALMTDAV